MGALASRYPNIIPFLKEAPYPLFIGMVQILYEDKKINDIASKTKGKPKTYIVEQKKRLNYSMAEATTTKRQKRTGFIAMARGRQ